MIDAAKLVAAHLASEAAQKQEQADASRATDESNPDRTYVGQPRVRLYVATPRGNA